MMAGRFSPASFHSTTYLTTRKQASINFANFIKLTVRYVASTQVSKKKNAMLKRFSLAANDVEKMPPGRTRRETSDDLLATQWSPISIISTR
jgi:hypothetical protein